MTTKLYASSDHNGYPLLIIATEEQAAAYNLIEGPEFSGLMEIKADTIGSWLLDEHLENGKDEPSQRDAINAFLATIGEPNV